MEGSDSVIPITKNIIKDPNQFDLIRINPRMSA